MPKGEPEFYYVTQWYYHILFLVVRELGLPEHNFKVTYKKHREYNPSIKTPRVLRWLTPFVCLHCDIKSAYPSFLDAITESNVGSEIYERIMKNKQCTRDDAKRHFNMMLNSGRKEYWKKDKAIQDLINWGYNKNQANTIILYTHDPEKSFTEHMSEIEAEAISVFAKANHIQNFVRLHDAILCIDDGNKPVLKSLENEKIRLDMHRPIQPVLNSFFGNSNRWLPYAYVSSCPNLKSLITRTTATSSQQIKGEADGFKFFYEPFDYISASFDLNDKFTKDEFMYKCKVMLSTIHYLTGRPVSDDELCLIIKHIRRNSNVMFSERFLFLELRKEKNIIEDIEVKSRDFEMTERKFFKRKIDFLKALNIAKGKVNKINRLKHIQKMLKKSIQSDVYEWIDFGIGRNRRKQSLIHCIANRINCLRTGKKQKFKAQNQVAYPLYRTYYKELGQVEFEPIQKSKYSNKNRLTQRKINKQEKTLIQYIKLQSNRLQAKQYLHIINLLLGEEATLKTDFIDREKQYLTKQMEVEDFEELILIDREKKLKPIKPTKDIFDEDLSNSIFNHVTDEQANARGFLDDYIKFHKKQKLSI